jgi:pimeloyl-ACP methyl ester carboxylesterase
LWILLFAAALLVVLALSGALYQALGAAADRRKFPPPGRMVDIGGRRLHLLETGAGGPSVVLEAGISASCLNWTAIQNELAGFARVCSYDRASLGWSEPADTPRQASRLVGELHALLIAAQIPGPYILVGHSFGGMLARGYATKYPSEVVGLVLVDPLRPADWASPSEEQSSMLRRGVRLARRGALLARLGVVRFSLALLASGGRRIPKLIARVSSGNGESAVSRLVGEVGKMPRETWPMIRAHWCQPKSFLGMSGHLEALPVSCAEAAECGDALPVPMVILSAATSTSAQLAERDALARRSHGKHIVVKGGHWIHLDEPELVVEAIREIMESLRVTHETTQEE